MHTYEQTRGRWTKDNILWDTGYSGIGSGLNNPDAEALEGIGPIPTGTWAIDGPPFDSPDHGPYCLRLIPDDTTITFGRSGFMIHGDEKEHPGQHLASHGCIILPRATRERIWRSGDQVLEVIR